jgi:hypothetical protein
MNRIYGMELVERQSSVALEKLEESLDLKYFSNPVHPVNPV